MVRTWATVAVLMTTGCSDLAELETEQAALEDEVAVLRDNVESIRVEMQRAGMIKAGPVPQEAAVEAPAADLTEQLPWSVSRTGKLPALDLAAPERRDQTDCGYRIDLPWLEAISDFSLANTGSGRASPVVLSIDGTRLTPHAGPPEFEKQCGGAFRHQGRYLFFSPSGASEPLGNLALGLADEVPFAREDGRPMFWVYPGTTLTISFSDGWDEAWGDLIVDADASLIHVGTAADPNPKPGPEATLTVLGQTDRSATTKLGLHVEPDPPTGPWTIEISSPQGGPYVVVQTLRVGNDDRALMIAGGPQ